MNAPGILVVVIFTAVPGKGAELRAAIERTFDFTREQPGFLEIQIAQNMDRPDEVLLLQRWRSVADHRGYMAVQESLGPPAPALRPLLAGPYTLAYYA